MGVIDWDLKPLYKKLFSKPQEQTTEGSKRMNSLLDKILDWAYDRNLVQGSTPQAQMLKLMEEMGELASGIAKKKRGVQADSIGDCLVVLTIIAEQLDLDLEACLAMAYDEIKDRKGQMRDGVFIKEEDL